MINCFVTPIGNPPALVMQKQPPVECQYAILPIAFEVCAECACLPNIKTGISYISCIRIYPYYIYCNGISSLVILNTLKVSHCVSISCLVGQKHISFHLQSNRSSSSWGHHITINWFIKFCKFIVLVLFGCEMLHLVLRVRLYPSSNTSKVPVENQQNHF